MTAYIVIVRHRTKDVPGVEEAIAKYREIAPRAPIGKLEIIAPRTCPFQVLEGDPVETVVIMRFPEMRDALEWYYSDAYQEAVKYRLSVGEFTSVAIDAGTAVGA